MRLRNHTTGEDQTVTAEEAAAAMGISTEELAAAIEDEGRCDTEEHTAWEGDEDSEPCDPDRDEDER